MMESISPEETPGVLVEVQFSCSTIGESPPCIVYEISFFKTTRCWANPKGLQTDAFSSLLTVVEVMKEVERHQSWHHVNQMAGKTLTSSTATALAIKQQLQAQPPFFLPLVPSDVYKHGIISVSEESQNRRIAGGWRIAGGRRIAGGMDKAVSDTT
jgi:hypothetical protein